MRHGVCWLCFLTLLFSPVFLANAVADMAPASSDLNSGNNPAPFRYKVHVKRVLDGDTLQLKSGEILRLIGVNAPEVDSRYHHAEAGGEAAQKWLEDYLSYSSIHIEYDIQRYDKYERELVHVFLENGEYLNAALLEAGQGVLMLIPPNVRHANQLIAAQDKAEREKKGVWNLPDYPLQQVSIHAAAGKNGWQRWQMQPKTIKKNRYYHQLMVSDHLAIRIPNQAVALFPKLDSYLGKTLEVRGELRQKNGFSTILVSHPTALIVRD